MSCLVKVDVSLWLGRTPPVRIEKMMVVANNADNFLLRSQTSAHTQKYHTH